ncbi:MAG: hypothetical protein HY269_03775 [Deltaproteobacteria bacterium]|nr:hypothetical protein [Deltaproteobacteria bacterium]
MTEEGVRYLVIGGYAVNSHGLSRRTDDFDVWIELSDENANRVSRAMERFGCAPREVTPDAFLERNKVIRMGSPPMRLEILNQIAGVKFSECYERRVKRDWGGVVADVIDLDDLIANKRAAGRGKDLADVDGLLRKKATAIKKPERRRRKP